MPIRFGSFTINGVDEMISPMQPEPQIIRRFFWGMKGNSEIFGGLAGRALSVRIYLLPEEAEDSRRGYRELIRTLDVWEKKAGDLADLVQQVQLETSTAGGSSISGTSIMRYRDCRFLGIERLPLPGQNQPQPTQGLGDLEGWFQLCRFMFWQLNADVVQE